MCVCVFMFTHYRVFMFTVYNNLLYIQVTAIKTILTVTDPFYLLKQLTSSIEGSKSVRQRERDIERDRNIERDIDCQKNHCYSHMILF